ncbi:MAG: outer membrane protein assembly factor BamB family protein [Thermoplasmatota archaeon]
MLPKRATLAALVLLAVPAQGIDLGGCTATALDSHPCTTWTASAAEPNVASPVVAFSADGKALYEADTSYGPPHTTLRAYNAATGALRWSDSLATIVTGIFPSPDSSRIVVSTNDQRGLATLQAIKASGALSWTLAGGYGPVAFSADGKTAYVAVNNALEAVNAAKGAVKWTQAHDGAGHAADYAGPILVQQRLLATATSRFGPLVAGLDASSGAVNWTSALPRQLCRVPLLAADPVSHQAYVLYSDSTTPDVCMTAHIDSLATGSGARLWSAGYAGPVHGGATFWTLVADPLNGVAVAGGQEAQGPGPHEAQVAVAFAAGAVRWDSIIPGTLAALVEDSALGQAWATGAGGTPGQGFVSGYDGATGARVGSATCGRVLDSTASTSLAAQGNALAIAGVSQGEVLPGTLPGAGGAAFVAAYALPLAVPLEVDPPV